MERGDWDWDGMGWVVFFLLCTLLSDFVYLTGLPTNAHTVL